MKMLNRRNLLRAGTLGGLATLAAGCVQAASPTAAPSPPPTRAAVPPTQAQAPTTAPTSQPQPASATAVPAVAAAPSAAPTQAAPAMGASIAAITSAAKTWLAGLSDAQRKAASFSLKNPEQVRWHWTNTGAFPRNGLSLNDMQPTQRELALALLRASLSEAGFKKANDIMRLQPEIGGDPLNYFVSFFGAPGDAAWGWRFEGHHVSRRFTIAGDRVTISPFFQGVWPTGSAAGKTIMQREEAAARELVRTMDKALAARAVFQASPPGQHVTWDQTYVKPLPETGVRLAELNSDGQALAREVLEAWTGTLSAGVAKAQLDRALAPGLDKLSFAWAGALEERKPHYYRIQGPTFLLEHDNTRNGAQHIHSVWRVFDEDFGQGLI